MPVTRLASVDSEEVASQKAIREQAIKDKKAEIKAKLSENKAVYKSEMKKAKAEYAERVRAIKQAVKEEYDAMVQKEKADYKLAISTNKDKDAIRARKAAYESFKETLPATRSNDLNGRLNSESFEFDTIKSGITSRYTRTKYDLKSDLEETIKTLKYQIDPVKHIEKEYQKNLKALLKAKKDALLHAELLFFFNFDGYYLMLPEEITTKIIQGLGSKVFTKTFRVSVPHDAYVISNEGLEFTIVDYVDYGSSAFYKAKGTMYGEEVTIYIKADGEHKVGDKVSVVPVLEKTEISETSLNIRLY